MGKKERVNPCFQWNMAGGGGIFPPPAETCIRGEAPKIYKATTEIARKNTPAGSFPTGVKGAWWGCEDVMACDKI